MSLLYSQGCWRKTQTPGSETKISLLLTVPAVDRGSALSCTTFLFSQGGPRRARWCLLMQRVTLQERNSELKEPKYFVIGYKQTCPTFAPEGAVICIILDNKAICLFPWSETHGLSSKAVCSKDHPWKDHLPQGQSVLWVSEQKWERTMENCLSTSYWCFWASPPISYLYLDPCPRAYFWGKCPKMGRWF